MVMKVAGVSSGECLDAFRYGHNGSINGDQAVGSVDFCIAAEYMIAAGVATGLTGPKNAQGQVIPTPGQCTLTGFNWGVWNHPFRAMIQTSQPRNSMGKAFSKGLNELFGLIVVVEYFGNIRTIGNAIVFSDICFQISCYTVGGNIDDWDMYTYSYVLSNPYPDHLHGLYNGSQ